MQMQKKSQLRHQFSCFPKSGIPVFFGSVILSGVLLLAGNIGTTHAADSYTKLLLHGDGANGSTTFTDSEATPKTASANGNAQISTAQNKFGGASMYFNGSGSYVSFPNSTDWNPGSGDFTIDTWANISTLPASGAWQCMASHWQDTNNGWGFCVENNAGTYQLSFWNYLNGFTILDSQNISISANTWYHFAVVRTGSIFRLFVNGIQQGADYSNATAVSDFANNFYIGGAGTGSYFNGYIDELRISKGIARWTANFTPPAIAYDSVSYNLNYTAGSNGTLTGTISQTVGAGSNGTAVTAVPNSGFQFVNWNDGSTQNPRTDINVLANKNVTANFSFDSFTKLLLHGDGANGSTTFTDSSASPKTVTANGNAQISTAQNKFGGASMYFNGSSYASIPNNADFDFGSGDFSIDFWLYQPSNTNYYAYVSKDTGSGSGRSWLIQTNYISNTIFFAVPNGHTASISGFSPAPSSWYHIYFGRSGNVMYKGLNGTVTSEAWTDTIPTSSTNVEIGRQGSYGNYFSGYIDELRINKGIARWTSSFTPPTSAYGSVVSYNLNYSAGSNGSLTGTTSQTVAQGQSSSAVTAVPNTGYHFVNWSDSSTSNPRTDTNVQGNISVTANFAINSYTLTYTAGTGGTLSGSTSQNVNYGANGTAVTANPSTGYHFVNWSDSSTQNPRTDTNVTSNLNLTANFSNTLTLTYAAGTNGTISGSSPQSVSPNANGTAVTAVPATGYHFVNWSDSSTSNPRTDTNVTNNITVTANFAINTYTLNYASGAHGTLSGTTSQTVNYNASGTAVTANPDASYHFTSWSDGSTQNPRTDANVISSKSVTASFSSDLNTVLLLHGDGTNGSTIFTDSSSYPKAVTASGNAQISTAQSRFGGASMHFDGSGTFLSTPNSADWSLGSGDFTIDYWANQTTLTSSWYNQQAQVDQVGGNGNVSWIVFSDNNKIAFGYSTNGQLAAMKSITSAGILTTGTWYHVAVVRSGSNITMYVNGTSVANGTETGAIFAGTSDLRVGLTHDTTNNSTMYYNGYIDELRISKGLARWTSNFTPPASPYDLTSSFNLSYNSGANGTLSGVASQTISSGGSGSAVTAIPSTGYHFVNWSDSSTANPRTDTNIQSNLSVTANFAINTYSLNYSGGTGGNISGTTSQTVNYNSNGTPVTAVPNTNFHFLNWSDGSTNNPRTDTNITQNKSVTANFALDDQTIIDPTPQKIIAIYNLGAFSLSDGTSASTSKATTSTVVTLKNNNASLTIPANTEITKTTSGNINITTLTTNNITSSIQQELGSSKAAIKIGILNVPLTFSQDVTINLPVSSSYNTETLTIYTRQDNAIDWTKETTCVVANSICSFTTRHATEYTANFEVSNSPDPTHVNMDINSTITIDCKDKNTNTNDYIAMNPITGTGKSTPNTNNDVNCNVITNNSNGYSLSFASSSPELISTTDNNNKINAYTPHTSNTPEVWNISSADSKWGARLESTSSTYDPTTWGTAGTDDYTAKWYQVTNSNNFILANRSTETAQTGDNQVIRFGAEIGANKFQPTGTYTDNVTFTAVTN